MKLKSWAQCVITEVLKATQYWMIGRATESRYSLVAHSQSDEGGVIEIEAKP